MRKRIVLFFIIILIIILGLSGCIQRETNIPQIQDGTLDVTGDYNLLNDKTVTLDGNWAFYWNKFLLGSEAENTQPDLFGPVPKAWNHYTVNGKVLPATGFATYRLHVKSDIPKGTVLGLQIPYFASAYRLYINDKEIAKNGTASTDKQHEVGCFSPNSVYFTAPEQNFDIVIQVSNFNCAYAGFWNSMSFGTANSIGHSDELTYAKIFFTYGIVLFVCIYSFVLFLMNRELKHCLYFSLLCLFSVLTVDAVDYQILFQGLMNISFKAFAYIWISAPGWCVFFLLALCHRIYPSKLSSVFVKVYLAICVCFQIIFTITEPILYTSTADVHNAASILGLVFATITAIYGIIKGQKEGWINILCLIILLAVYSHDVLLLTNVIYNPFGKMCYLGILVCILLLMSMTLVINKRYNERLEASELAFLQAQIKPHFIFNTVNALIALSYEDIDKTRTLMSKFSQYLRNSFDFTGTNQFVSFEKEMEYVTAFVEIQKARFEERLAVEFEIDEEIHTDVPILVLQPVIENAIVHGILPKVEGGKVAITITKQAEHITFCVEDNGVGFDIARWGITKPKQSNTGVGLHNIDRRLKKLTREGLSIQSELGVGTKVCWKIPIGNRRKRYI